MRRLFWCGVPAVLVLVAYACWTIMSAHQRPDQVLAQGCCYLRVVSNPVGVLGYALGERLHTGLTTLGVLPVTGPEPLVNSISTSGESGPQIVPLQALDLRELMHFQISDPKPTGEEECEVDSENEISSQTQTLGKANQAAEAGLDQFWRNLFPEPNKKNMAQVKIQSPPGAPGSKEEENISYHQQHPDCPYTGACPFCGRSPSAPNAKKESSVRTTSRKKAPGEASNPSSLSKTRLGPVEAEECEDCPAHPEVDTMEFRPSDARTKDFDYLHFCRPF